MAISNSEIQKYDVDYYTQKTMAMLKDKGLSGCYTEKGVRANVNAWMNNKQGLFDLLRKHPNWNEEAKAIVFTNEEIRMPNKNDYEYFFNEMIYAAQCNPDIWENILKNRNENAFHFNYNIKNVLNFFRSYIFEPNISEANVDSFKTNYIEVAEAIHLSAGQKTSRVLNRLFKFCRINELPEYNKLFAKLSDSINPLTTTKISVLSVNFIDYLLMSNGNSWSTCQTIVPHECCDGIYKAGTVSYANDKLTMVYYTIDKNYEGTDFCLEPKITRQLFFYKNNLLVQERLYPKTHDNDNTASDISLVSQYRNVVENIIAVCENKPNFWEKTDVDICATSDSFMYRDWDHFSHWVYKIKDEDCPKRITVGSTSYCFRCGEERNNDDEDNARELYCCDCKYYVRCDHCGEEINTRYRSNYTRINNKIYCFDCNCVTYCSYHECFELNSENSFIELENMGTVCKEAFDYLVSQRKIFKCAECGKYGLISRGYDVLLRFYNGKPVCQRCLNEFSSDTISFNELEMSYVS